MKYLISKAQIQFVVGLLSQVAFLNKQSPDSFISDEYHLDKINKVIDILMNLEKEKEEKKEWL